MPPRQSAVSEATRHNPMRSVSQPERHDPSDHPKEDENTDLDQGSGSQGGDGKKGVTWR